MLGRTDSRSRLLVLLLVFVVAAFAVVGRLAYWQVLQRDDLTAQAVAQTTKQVSEPSRRGPASHRDLARGRAAPRLPADRRRTRLDARGPAPRVRQPRGLGAVRRRA